MIDIEEIMQPISENRENVQVNTLPGATAGAGYRGLCLFRMENPQDPKTEDE